MKPIDVEGDCPYNSGENQKFSTKCVWEVAEARNWHDADLECSKMARKYGSHLPGFLMSVHSVHDVDFLLKDIAAGDSWIGLTTDRQGSKRYFLVLSGKGY